MSEPQEYRTSLGVRFEESSFNGTDDSAFASSGVPASPLWSASQSYRSPRPQQEAAAAYNFLPTLPPRRHTPPPGQRRRPVCHSLNTPFSATTLGLYGNITQRSDNSFLLPLRSEISVFYVATTEAALPLYFVAIVDIWQHAN